MGARTLCDDYYIIFITLIYIAWFQIYKLANSLKGQYHPPLPFLHNENILSHLPAILMSRRHPSKGLAGFAALINNTNLSAARIETNTGLHSGSSSKRSRGGAGSQSKAGKPVWVLDSSTC